MDPLTSDNSVLLDFELDNILAVNDKSDYNDTIPISAKICNTGGMVNYEKWNNFSIPWDKMPSYVLAALKQGNHERKIINEVVQVIVNEMREISKNVPSKAMRILTEKLIVEYPTTFKDVDEVRIIIGDGCHSIFSKLVDRNNYLNRPHKRTADEPRIPRKKVKAVVNSRAGCSNWQPDVVDGKKDELKQQLEGVNENDEGFWLILEKVYPDIRLFLNYHINIPTINDVQKE